MIGLREDQQMKARMVNFLNNATTQCVGGGATIREQVESSHRRSHTGVTVNVRGAAGSGASKAAG